MSNTAIPDSAVCLGCGYSLRGLIGRVCPECGRRFDPAKRHTYGPPPGPPGVSRHDKTFALAVVYGVGLFVGLLTLWLSPYFGYLLIPILAALAWLIFAPLAPSDICDCCGRQFKRNIPERCPDCGADMGTDRKRYDF